MATTDRTREGYSIMTKEEIDDLRKLAEQENRLRDVANGRKCSQKGCEEASIPTMSTCGQH